MICQIRMKHARKLLSWDGTQCPKTSLFQTSIELTSVKFRFIGHIRVDDENLLITLSMLRFGQIVRGLKPKRMHMYKCDDAKTKIKYLEVGDVLYEKK